MILNRILFFVPFIILYSPKIFGKTYLGIIYLFLSLLLIILFRKFKLDFLSRFFLFYIFLITILDLIAIYNSKFGIFSILEIFVYNLFPFASFLIGSYIKEIDRKNIFLKVIFYSGLLQGIVGLNQLLFTNFRNLTLNLFSNFEKYNSNFESWKFGRIVGSIGNPNSYGIFIAIYLLFLIIFFKNIEINKRIKKFSFVISISALIMSQSSTAYIVTIFLLIISLFFKKSKYKISYNHFIIPLNFNYFMRRISFERIKNFGGRLSIWKNLYQKLVIPLDYHILFGYGSIFMQQYTADNYYVKIFLEYGMIGFLSFMILWFLFLVKGIKLKSKNKKVFISVLIFIIFLSNLTLEPLKGVKLAPFIYLLLGYLL